MKKIVTLFVLVGSLVFTSCEGPDGPPGPPGEDGLIAEVFELTNVSFVNDPSDSPDLGYYIFRTLQPVIYDSDQILIYRKSGNINANTPIWQPIPRTLYLAQGELDYDFDFSKEDFTIYAGGTYNLALTPEYLNNQTFRIVIVPGYFSSAIDKNDYHAVVKALNISESEIQKIEVQK